MTAAPTDEPVAFFTILRLDDKLSVEIYDIENHRPETQFVSEHENLPSLLDDAIALALVGDDWQGLFRLRQCLMEWAVKAEAALRRMAEKETHG